jgi:ATP-binding cassette subfamily B protein
VDQGRITLEGVDVRSLRLADLRESIGVVPQEPALFSGSVRENIAYARPGASEADVEAAARAAHAAEFVERLPQRYDTLVGERGVKLSGGQRQRIALARVILKDAPILVLDEATSALDSEVELAIQEQLLGLMEGKTVIAIAHRLSTIARMDRLIVLEQGRIVESGTHEELLRLGGHYEKLWRHQSGGFLADDVFDVDDEPGMSFAPPR